MAIFLPNYSYEENLLIDDVLHTEKAVKQTKEGVTHCPDLPLSSPLTLTRPGALLSPRPSHRLGEGECRRMQSKKCPILVERGLGELASSRCGIFAE